MAGIAKSTTIPAYMTTPYTVELTKGFHSFHRKPRSRRPNPSADQSHEQCSHPPPPVPKPNRATMQGFQARQENHSLKLQCPWYLLESQSDSSSPQEPLQCPTLQDMTGTARPPSTHDQSTDQAGTNQAMTHGCLLDPIKPELLWQE